MFVQNVSEYVDCTNDCMPVVVEAPEVHCVRGVLDFSRADCVGRISAVQRLNQRATDFNARRPSSSLKLPGTSEYGTPHFLPGTISFCKRPGACRATRLCPSAS